MQKIFFNLVFSLITYFIYVYPFDVLTYLLTNKEIIKISSLFVTLFFSVIIFFYFKSKNNFFLLRLFVYEGMGIGFISFWVCNVGLAINHFSSASSYKIGIGCFFSIAIVTIFSLINARGVIVRKLNFNSLKLKKSVKIIFFSDVHLGSNSLAHLEKILTKIKNLQADFIIIGGDLIDSSSFKLDNLSVLNNLGKPIYFISGNHEYYLKDHKQKLSDLGKFKVNFLDNKSFTLKGINIIGISDNQEDIDQIKIAKKKFKRSLFNLLVIHKPTIWNSIHENFDLMLSGHTHNGQIFPFNFIVKYKFKNTYGIYKKFNSLLYVSSGAGCWGPKMRLGSQNEVIHISINKK